MLKATPTPRRGKAGFTLIELLASIAILMVIVWMLAAIFRESDRAWAMGTGRVDNNIEGRAVLQMIATDLQYAISDSNQTFMLRYERDRTSADNAYMTYGHTNSELCFVTLSSDASPTRAGDERRAAREIIYYLRTLGNQTDIHKKQYRIMRSEFSTAMLRAPAAHSYSSTNWFELPRAGKQAAQNIVSFAAYVPDPNNPSKMIREYNSLEHGYELPPYVDIYVEILNDKEAEQLAIIETDFLLGMRVNLEARNKFIEENARRYTRRVYLQNKLGYLPRGDYPNRNL